jgi:iron complex transport system substrate-binding protein
MSLSTRRRPGVALLALSTLTLTALALSGCATESATSGTPSAAAATSVDNCGTTVNIGASAPRRVVTIKSTATEMLLALGLGSHIVGTAYQDGPVPAQWAKAVAGIPSLSDRMPSEEATLNLNPDFIYAGWESSFSADAAGTRDSLAALGVRSYVSPSACKESAYQPKKLGFDDIFGEIAEVGKIFHIDASLLITRQRAELATIKPVSGKHTALWFSSGSTIPYVGAGIGTPELMMETIGLTNIASGVKDTWTSYSWESVINANPDVIVLVDASWSTAAKKIGVLESNPATAKLDAVKNKRFLIVPFAASEAGVRTVSATADLTNQLAKLGLG